MRLIDADALNKKLCETTIFIKDGVAFQRMINDAPTIDAVPVKHGEWEYVANEIMKNRHGILGDIYGSPMFMNYECSECKFHIANDLKGITDHRTAYCPNCGAKMDKGGDHLERQSYR